MTGSEQQSAQRAAYLATFQPKALVPMDETARLISALAAECSRLRTLNAELVEALRLADTKLHGWLDASHEEEVKEKVRAALAKAKDIMDINSDVAD